VKEDIYITYLLGQNGSMQHEEENREISMVLDMLAVINWRK